MGRRSAGRSAVPTPLRRRGSPRSEISNQAGDPEQDPKAIEIGVKRWPSETPAAQPGRGVADGCDHVAVKRYRACRRQLITRLDDDLHARLRERAAAEGRSVNALVVEILAAEVAPGSRRERLRRRARAAGWLIVPPRPDRAPSWEAVEEATRGAGTAVSEALEAERARR
jgi:plasmid stability protein